RLRDAEALLPAQHVVAAVEDGRQALGDRVSRGLLLLSLRLDAAHLRVDVALARRELLLELLGLGVRRLDLDADSFALGGELRDLLLAIAHQLAELFQLALRGVRLALGPRAVQL